MEESKLEPDEGTVDAELPDYHPCQIVQSNSFGIFGRPGMKTIVLLSSSPGLENTREY